MTNQSSILIVDDSMTSRMLFSALVPNDGTIEILQAGNAEEAVNCATTKRPDVIVLDFNLPGEDGVQIAERIKSAGVTSKLILLTANVQQEISDRAKIAGFRFVLEKPITESGISRIVREIQ